MRSPEQRSESRERLKEIEKHRDECFAAREQFPYEDMAWLINRVKRLTSALEESCHCGYGEHTKGMKCNSCKALDDEA